MSILSALTGADPTADLDRLAGRAIELLAQRRAKAAELASAEQQAGEQFLDGDQRAAGRILRLRVELEGITRGLEACAARQAAHVERLYRQRVSEIRRTIAERREELGTLDTRTARVLEQLAELQEVAPSDLAAPQYQPRSFRLRAEIEQFEQRLGEVERGGIHAAGDVTAEGDLSALVRALFRGEWRMPPLLDIEDWALDCETAARKAGAGQHLETMPAEVVFRSSPAVAATSAPRKFRLIWRGGAIDRDASYMLLPGVGRRTKEHPAITREQHTPGDPYGPMTTVTVQPAWTEAWLDVAAATFRAGR